MIEIIFSIRKSSCSLKVKGHSCYSNKGEDIVCAAVSALVQTFICGCETQLQGKVDGDLKSGNCDVTVEVTPEKKDSFAAVCNVFYFGFRKLAEAYPDHIKTNLL